MAVEVTDRGEVLRNSTIEHALLASGSWLPVARTNESRERDVCPPIGGNRRESDMKPSKLREMAREDLVTEEGELRQQLFKLRFQTATGQLESASKARGVRRD